MVDKGFTEHHRLVGAIDAAAAAQAAADAAQADADAAQADIDAHEADSSDAHDASAISFTPTGTIAATDVQAAIAEVSSEAGSDLAAHEAASDPHTGYQKESEKGVAGGYASLDGGGKVPVGQLPNSIMQYKGMWDASTNTPTLANGAGNADEDIGNVYKVSVSGSVDFGAGSISFIASDYVILNDSKVWEKSDTTDVVSSIFGRTGAVSAAGGDYNASQITNTPAGTISSTDLQATVNELDGDITAETAARAAADSAHVAAGDPHSQYQKESEKDAAGGYAGLDGSSKLNGAQQTYGSSANTACEGNDSRLSDSRAPTGSAGGVLGGTYPNPSFAVDMATQAELDAHVADADPHTGYQLESEKDAANGYAGLDANSRLLSTRLQVSATDRLIGRDSASAGASEELTVSGGVEFSGSGGIRRSALTGDAIASAGSNAVTLVGIGADFGVAAAITTISTDRNDFSIGGNTTYLFDLGANVNFTGAVKANSYGNQWFIICNLDSTFSITVKHESASSTAANRFNNPNGQDIVIGPGKTALFHYNPSTQGGSLSRWLYLAGSALENLSIPTAALQANSATNAKLAQMAAHTIKGNNTGSAADPSDLTLTNVRDELDLIKKDANSTIAAGTNETWLCLASNSGDITGTGLTTVLAITALPVGRYSFYCQLVYQTTATGTGVDVAVNFTGTTTQFNAESRYSSTGQTAATSAATEAGTDAAGQIYVSQGQRTLNTIIGSGPSSVDAANTDMFMIIEGFLVVSVTGDLQIKLAAESAGLVCKAMQGSNLVLRRFS